MEKGTFFITTSEKHFLKRKKKDSAFCFSFYYQGQWLCGEGRIRRSSAPWWRGIEDWVGHAETSSSAEVSRVQKLLNAGFWWHWNALVLPVICHFVYLEYIFLPGRKWLPRNGGVIYALGGVDIVSELLRCGDCRIYKSGTVHVGVTWPPWRTSCKGLTSVF